MEGLFFFKTITKKIHLEFDVHKNAFIYEPLCLCVVTACRCLWLQICTSLTFLMKDNFLSISAKIKITVEEDPYEFGQLGNLDAIKTFQ